MPRRHLGSRVVIAVLAVAVLATAAAHAAPTPVEVGTLKGAGYRIDVPPNWNGGLVLYCHGYREGPIRFDANAEDEVAQTFAPLGFAVAQSGYSMGGYALREAAAETEGLRRFFVGRHGAPKETWLAGSSLGGSITMMLLEQHPTTYDGGLSMCAPLGAALAYIKVTAFDLLVLFERAFPGVLPSPANVPPSFVMTIETAQSIERLLDRGPKAAEPLRRYTSNQSNQELGRNLDLFTYILGELQKRWGGNAFDNDNTIYTGLGDDLAINDQVKRYRADERARAMAIRDYTPTGHLSRPLLAIRTAQDPLIGSFSSDRYAETTQLAGRDALFAQRYTAGQGHCAFEPDEIRNAFLMLRRWRLTGKRPPSGASFRKFTELK
jgi:pimeloyl-ACP methyl ester carboxylesterase